VSSKLIRGRGREPAWLHTLLLDDNALSNRMVPRLLQALEHDSCLQTLSLASNSLHDMKVASAVRSLLRHNRTLTDLDLRHNKLQTESGKELCFGLLENQTLRFLRLKGNSALKAEELELIEGQLVGNRRQFFFPHRGLRVVAMPGWTPDGFASPPPGATEGHSREGPEGKLSSSVGSGSSGGLGLTTPDKTLRKLCSCSEAWTGRSSNEDRIRQGRTHPLLEHLQGCPHYIQTVEHHRSVSAPASVTKPFESIEKTSGSRYAHGLQESGDGRGPGLQLEGILKEESGGNRSDVLSVLFSAPLAWRDLAGQLHPIEMLEFEQERELLIQAFTEAGCDVELRFDFATTDRLRSAVTLGCRALHYSGHGHKNRLTFEDGSGGLQFVNMDTLRSLCAAGERQLEFVFVSACFSRLAGQAFQEAGVPHVVCVNVDAQLADSAALAFTKAFYLALAVGDTVLHAFEIGRQAVAASPHVPNPQIEGDKFLLLPTDQDHNVSIFAGRPLRGGVHRMVSGWAYQNAAHLPTPPEDFLGREVDMYRTINACLNRRLITLLGASGIGKSALAYAVCQYIAVRRYLPDGIVLVRLQHKKTLEQLVQAITTAVTRQLPPEEPTHEGLASVGNASRAFMSGGMAGSRVGDRGSSERDDDALFARLRHLKCLLVLDHIEELQAQDNLDLKVFLRQLFDQTKSARVLVTSSQPVDLHTLPGTGVGECLVSVGPLTLRNTVRLFSRQCPHLHTSRERRRFLEALVAPDQAHVTYYSR
jgi:hypothetical protein